MTTLSVNTEKMKETPITCNEKKKRKRRITPKTFIRKTIFDKNIVLQKKRKKMKEETFQILNFKDYENILVYNYNVKQLRCMCRFYKQKISGNKKDLIYLMYNYLKYSYYAEKIQKIFKGHIVRKIFKLKGPAFLNRNLCINDRDFLTFDSIKNIKNEQFFSYKDIDNFVYGFDICSIYNMLNEYDKNPYNRNNFPKKLKNNVIKIIKLSNLINMKVNISLGNNEEEMSHEKKIKLKAIDIFQNIDNSGFITNVDWFLSLNRIRLKRYLRELVDIWNYRSQINNETRRKINPQHGDPFFGFNVQVLLHKSKEVLQNRILDIINVFITKGEDNDSRSLGIYYVLGAFTMVHSNAAHSLPWLYESFYYQN